MTNHNNSLTPFSRDLGNFVDHFFNRSVGEFVGNDFARSIPAVNVIENADNFRIDLAAPGLEKTDFNIHVENKTMTISAKKEATTKTDKDNFKRREFSYSSFERSFTLPKNIDVTTIVATYENGILAITLPKVTTDEEDGIQNIDIS